MKSYVNIHLENCIKFCIIVIGTIVQLCQENLEFFLFAISSRVFKKSLNFRINKAQLLGFRLFWINWDSIYSCKTDGSDLTTHLNSISVLFFGVELMVYKVPMAIYIQTDPILNKERSLVIELFNKQRPKKLIKVMAHFVSSRQISTVQ